MVIKNTIYVNTFQTVKAAEYSGTGAPVGAVLENGYSAMPFMSDSMR